MRIYRPGLPPQYIGEKAPKPIKAGGAEQLPSVAEAMARAQARQTQILDYTRPKTPIVEPTANGPQHPHAINLKPEVQK